MQTCQVLERIGENVSKQEIVRNYGMVMGIYFNESIPNLNLFWELHCIKFNFLGFKIFGMTSKDETISYLGFEQSIMVNFLRWLGVSETLLKDLPEKQGDDRLVFDLKNSIAYNEV